MSKLSLLSAGPPIVDATLLQVADGGLVYKTSMKPKNKAHSNFVKFWR